jgi:hypothetical protein
MKTLLNPGDQPSGTSSPGETLSVCLESVDTPAGRARVATYLEQQAFPHYETHASQLGLLERIEQDGTRTVGRFVNRQFVPLLSQ